MDVRTDRKTNGEIGRQATDIRMRGMTNELTDRSTNVQTDRTMDGQMDTQGTEGQTDGHADRWTDKR
jgi:hypothetical protein